jgi:CotH kinase protein
MKPAGMGMVVLLGLRLAADSVSASRTAPDTFAALSETGSAVQEIRLDLSPAALTSLRLAPRKSVPATLHVGSTDFPKVQLHLKGSTGSFRPVDDRPSLTITLGNEAGSDRIHLENSVEDPSRLHQWLGAELFREAGLPVPSVTLAHVTLAGRGLGLYVVREGYDGAFLRRSFGSPAVVVGEPEPGQDVGGRWKLKPGSPAIGVQEAQSALDRLAAASRLPDSHQRWQALTARLDVTRFATLLAGEVLLEHRDGYALARNNVRMVWNPADGRWTFLPHGMDQLLVEAGFTRHPQISGEIARAFMSTDEGKRAYDQQWTALANAWMDPIRLTARVRTHAAGLESRLAPDEVAVLRRETNDLVRRLRRRCAEVASQRAEPTAAATAAMPGPILLRDWQPLDAPEGGTLRRESRLGSPVRLYITAGPVTAAAWQCRLTLPAGRYRLEGLVGAHGLRPLPFGQHQGAALRVSGDRPRSTALTTNATEVLLQVDFEVSGPGEDVRFLCELRASAGEAWFDGESLRVVRRE